MDSKLKALKVVDLKDILFRAGVAAPSKSNKTDLIARILASPAAIDVYNSQHPSGKPTVRTGDSTGSQKASQGALPPPAGAAPVATVPTPPAASLSSPTESPAPANSSPVVAKQTLTASQATGSSTPVIKGAAEDEEVEKRKARAARFGLPLVESTGMSSALKPKSAAIINKPSTSTSDDPEKLAARAARFGTAEAAAIQVKSPSNGRKRSAPPLEPADAEEMEKRRKRAERFGVPVVGTKA